MKALSGRVSRLEQRRPPPIAVRAEPDFEELKAKIRQTKVEGDRRELLPAREQLKLCLADYQQSLVDRQTRDPNRGAVARAQLDAVLDMAHEITVAELQARVEAEDASTVQS